MGGKQYYWLKLKRDFFKRHDIQILESTDNGKDYVLFYLKLLLESIDHDGSLRFSETIPYNDKMLSVITNTNIDIVKSAMEKLIALGLIEVMSDSTIYMNEVERMLGTETYWAEQKRNKRNECNSNLKEIGQSPTCPTIVQPLSTQEIDIELDKDIDKKIDRKKKSKEFIPPSLQEIKKYINERKLVIEPEYFFNYFTDNNWVDSKGNEVKSWKQKILNWDKNEREKNPKKVAIPERRLTPEEQIAAAKAKYFIK